MKYTIVTRNQPVNRPFFIWVATARSALTVARDLADHGVEELAVLDQNGRRYNLAELEHLAAEAGA